MKLIALILAVGLLITGAWFVGHLLEYNKWWNRLPSDHELKNIDDAGENPILVILRRGFRWRGNEEIEALAKEEPKESMADVRKAQGNPDRSEIINGQTWYFYGNSFIRFDEAGYVEHIYNAGNLKGLPVATKASPKS